MQMTDEVPSHWAASATPCAWFPADEQMTPLASSDFGILAILLNAPRSLNEKTGCKSSRFSQILFPVSVLSSSARSSGVSFCNRHNFQSARSFWVFCDWHAWGKTSCRSASARAGAHRDIVHARRQNSAQIAGFVMPPCCLVAASGLL